MNLRVLTFALIANLVLGLAPLAAQDAPPSVLMPDPLPRIDLPPQKPYAVPLEIVSDEPVQLEPTSLSSELSVQAELSRLGLTQTAGGGLIDPALQLSGFADFRFLSLLVRKHSAWRGALERYPAFSVGNVNLFLGKNLTDTLRMFGEVRFTLLPNGAIGSSSDLAQGEYVSTLVQDYADFNRPLRWAGIEIERLYIEWSPWMWLTVRAGMFLTPYGVWNLDHGSPTVIAAQRPFVIGQALFPEHQTGLEVYGELDLTSLHSFGYYVTLSNGLGPVSDYRDFDANKAVGVRGYWQYEGLGALRVGGSFFWGTDTAAREVPALASDGKHITYNEKITEQADVLALAGDVQWTYAGLLVQAEVVTRQRHYDERGRIGSTSPLAGRYIAPSDALSWGAYGLLGYRFEWFGVMPFALLETIDSTDASTAIRLRTRAFTLGFNVRPTDGLVLKLQYTEARFPDDNVLGNAPLRSLQCQLAWAF